MGSAFERNLAGPVGRWVLVAVASAAPFAAARADTVVVTAVKDNTLYQHSSGTLSNGAGSYFFVGQTGQQRAVRGVQLRGLRDLDRAGGGRWEERPGDVGETNQQREDDDNTQHALSASGEARDEVVEDTGKSW